MDGNVIEETGNKGMVPFLFQGQYYDRETGLAYNRFRYYSPKMGMYISQDPIGLAGKNPTLYGYVANPNIWVDIFGLAPLSYSRSRRDGMTTEQHIRLHEVNDLTKPKHGVFSNDSITMTNNAWNNGNHGVTPIRQANGNDKYVIPFPGAGTEGGYSGSGGTLNSITIITEAGTNNVITSFPST
jgi:RHS repeat-associated protein